MTSTFDALAARANAEVVSALSHDEAGRRAEAVVGYRSALRALSAAAAAAPRGAPQTPKLGARRQRVEERLAVLSGQSQPLSVSYNAPPGAKLWPAPRVQGQVQAHAQQRNGGGVGVGAGAAGGAGVGQAVVVHADKEMVAAIESEMLDTSPNVHWDDVAGAEDVKEALQELLIRPALRPDLYTGIRSPAKGLLLAGPPGTGKTLCAKAAATECSNGMGKQVSFFSVSASTFASKWHGDGEKLVRALFEVAKARQPSLIFIDEIDSLLGKRGQNDHEASRRLKTEFLVQVDGCGGSSDSEVWVMGACNQPQLLDDAVLRRLSKRIYVPLPSPATRFALLRKLTSKSKDVKFSVTDADLKSIAAKMEFFSGADIHALVREAALMPLRELSGNMLSSIDAKRVRGVNRGDFEAALRQVKPSVSREQLAELEKWDREFGMGSSSAGASSGMARSRKITDPSSSSDSAGTGSRVWRAIREPPSKPERHRRKR